MSDFPLCKAAGLLNMQFKQEGCAFTLIPAKDVEAHLAKTTKALNLALYYVEGDATYESVNEMVEEILGHKIQPNKKDECVCDEINARHCSVHQEGTAQEKSEFKTIAAKLETVQALLDDNEYDAFGNAIGKKKPIITENEARQLLGFGPNHTVTGTSFCMPKENDRMPEASEFFKPDDCDKYIHYTGTSIGDFGGSNDKTEHYLSVEKANRLLRERGTVVYGNPKIDHFYNWGANKEDDGCSHQALLINIQPIAKAKEDTAEAFLREFVELADMYASDESEWNRLAEKAKKLLETK